MTARRWPVGAAVIALAVAPGTPANADAPDEQVTEPGLTAEVLPVPPPPAPGIDPAPPAPGIDPAPPAPGIDPAPPAPMGLIPPISTIGGLLGQTGIEPAGPLGLPDLATYGNALVLGQNLVPSIPGTAEQAVTPSLEVFTDEYLVPLNLVPAAPGEGSPAPASAPTRTSPEPAGSRCCGDCTRCIRRAISPAHCSVSCPRMSSASRCCRRRIRHRADRLACRPGSGR